MTLQQQIRSARMRTLVVMLLFFVLMALIVAAVYAFFGSGFGLIMLMVAIGYAFFGYIAAGSIVAATAGAHKITKADAPGSSATSLPAQSSPPRPAPTRSPRQTHRSFGTASRTPRSLRALPRRPTSTSSMTPHRTRSRQVGHPTRPMSPQPPASFSCLTSASSKASWRTRWHTYAIATCG
jgi:hypothetical protein